MMFHEKKDLYAKPRFIHTKHIKFDLNMTRITDGVHRKDIIHVRNIFLCKTHVFFKLKPSINSDQFSLNRSVTHRVKTRLRQSLLILKQSLQI